MSGRDGAPSPGVTVVDRQRTTRLSPVRIAAFAEYVLERQRRAGAQVTIMLVGDRAMRALNRRWRGKDATTDVLSFSQQEGEGGGLHPELLGDVVVCVPAALRQAREGRCCLAAELDRLVAHGLLHLLGYEHEGDPAGARAMRRREEALLRGWRR
jgi:probable rRNA maturation factor